MSISNNAAGIYLHIPFCHRACHYCNFHFSTSQQLRPAYVSALIMELEQRRAYLGEQHIRSIYFGGGTPSILSGEELGRILHKIRELFTVFADAEITLEANPDDIRAASVQQWAEAGINRLSIGIQSFRDKDLQWMNRNHTGSEARAAIKTAVDGGIKNISADLIYGIPGLSDNDWKQNIDILLENAVQHISAYALTVESKTALAHFIAKGIAEAPDELESEQQFFILRERLSAAGFDHYEISNFAKENHIAVHNSSYWKGMHYLGLGASAHSFNGISRQWNIASNALYIKAVEGNGAYYEQEVLTPSMQMNERIMTGLRTKWGVDLQAFAADFGADNTEVLLHAAEDYLENGIVVHKENALIISPDSWFVADGLIADLFFDTE